MVVYQSPLTVRQFFKATVATCPVLLKKAAIIRFEALRSRATVRFIVERQIRGSAVGCMLHVNACCRQASCLCLMMPKSQGGRAIISKFVTKIDAAAFEFRKLVTNSCLARCFIAKSSFKPS
ncbi:hypothetical protein EVAR_35955_1 [Eumeta japonica]|uniref:Uncharacterized protein n=1 Tax=Eumeta variegata TaxID=151549 RepID=A0A4C1W2F4_EUMVA|nr:hypothetical protein EVAR_35955_1 [Eumeta japonica]